MFNPTAILTDRMVEEVQRAYMQNYGGYKPDYASIIAWSARMALENIANSDALYHNVEHTVHVTLVGQEIMRGRHIREGGVSCEDWLHVTIALLCHDIGYVKGVCRLDSPGRNRYVTGRGDETVDLAEGATDASLAPYHVDRGKQYIEQRFGGHKLIDAEFIKSLVELTRFPIPEGEAEEHRQDYRGLVRAADLIGQLSDPRYLNKIGALYYEFEEIGINQKLGFQSPGDLRRGYSRFFWSKVFPFVTDAIDYLKLTQEGKMILANLYANVFQVEHQKTGGTLEPAEDLLADV